jgi:hypothetical protein
MSLFPILVLSGLALLWGWVLVRPALQNMMNGSRRDPVGHFNRQLSVLSQTSSNSSSFSAGSWQYQPARKRRLQLFLALGFAVVVSLVLAVAFRGIFIWQHILLDLLFVGYVVLASRAGANELARSQKVTYLGSTTQRRPNEYAKAVGDR